MTSPKPRRRSIRFAIVAVVCLLLGVVTTVGVAWRAALQWPWPYDEATGNDASQHPWPNWAPTDVTNGYRLHRWRAWPEAKRPWAREEEEWFGLRVQARQYLCGWPLPALRSRGLHPEDFRPTRFDSGCTFVSWQTGLRMVAVTQRPTDSWGYQAAYPNRRADKQIAYVVHFPLFPLFPGFALDTAVYAAAWYVVMFTPLPLIRAGRRRFRVSRGMCGSCGYDLKGSKGGPCPECGA